MVKVWKLFFIYTRGKEKNPFFHFSDFLVFPKILKKEYNIRFKIYPSPFTSSPQHISIIVFPTFVFWLILRRYSAIFRRYFRILRRYSAIFRSNFRVNEFRNVIVWQAEEPIRYRPQEANLMRIRTKSSKLRLFNPKKQLFMK